MPIKVIKEIERIQRNFLWDHCEEVVPGSSSIVSRSKKHGGWDWEDHKT